MLDSKLENPNLVLAVGTQVVATIEIKATPGSPYRPRGAVGVIVKAPADNTHAYRVRFPDGAEANLHRHELAILSHFQVDGLQHAGAMAEYDLYRCVIYRCVVGSRAYGLDEAASDTDYRGIYLPPADMLWSLYGVPEQLENDARQECFWELQKFLVLGLKANPNVLECLNTPLVEHAAPLAAELLDMKAIFLSKLVYQTYNGYVMSQFRKLEGDIRNQGTIKWKHAMHLIRLLLSGITVLREGFVPVRVEDYRERLLSIRRGEVPWDDVNAWRLELHRQFDEEFGRTTLPDAPDYAQANAFLLKARRSMT